MTDTQRDTARAYRLIAAAIAAGALANIAGMLVHVSGVNIGW